MSAELLRRAAAQIRNDHGGAVSRHTRDGRRWLPVADWLDVLADRADEIAETFPAASRRAESVVRATVDGWNEACVTARAYLAEES